MKNLYITAALLALAGCASAPRTLKHVDVPVAVGCLGKAPARPVSKYGVGTWPGDKAAAQLALKDANAWERYAISLESAMAGCEPRSHALGQSPFSNEHYVEKTINSYQLIGSMIDAPNKRPEDRP